MIFLALNFSFMFVQCNLYPRAIRIYNAFQNRVIVILDVVFAVGINIVIESSAA